MLENHKMKKLFLYVFLGFNDLNQKKTCKNEPNCK